MDRNTTKKPLWQVNEKGEKKFLNNTVLPYLGRRGHKVLEIDQALELAHTKETEALNPRADVTSVFQGSIYFTEIKADADISKIQSAIGQLIIHQFIHETLKHGGVKYQMIFPDTSSCRAKFSASFLTYLSELGIDVLFL